MRFLLAALLLTCTARLPAQSAREVQRQLQERQTHLEALRRERANLERELEGLKGRAHTIRDELVNLERQRENAGRVVSELDWQIAGLGLRVERVTAELVLAENSLQAKRAVAQRRVVEISKRGPLRGFQVLLAAESFGDLLSRYKYLFLVSRQDRSLAQEMEELRNDIAEQRGELLGLTGELERQRDDRSREFARYRSLEERTQQSLAETRRTEEQTARRISQLSAEEEAIRTIVARLERERVAAEARGTGALAAPTITMDDVGRLDWPVEGRLAYRFGAQEFRGRTTIRWPGIGIRAPAGTPVKAVRAGRVADIRTLGTWRTGVFLDHGGGFYTIYLQLQRAAVERNDIVMEGQVIGYIAEATDLPARLHFEIREGDIALDPQAWLKPR